MQEFDYEMLALRASARSEQAAEDFINDNGDINEITYDAWGIDFETFMSVSESLLGLTSKVQLAMRGTVVHTFVSENTIIVRGNEK